MLTQFLGSIWTNQPSAASPGSPVTPTDAGATVANFSETERLVAPPTFCANHLVLQQPPRESSRNNTDVQAAAMNRISVSPVTSCNREKYAGNQLETLKMLDGLQRVRFMRSTDTTFTDHRPQKTQRRWSWSSSATTSFPPPGPSLTMENSEELLNVMRKDTSVVTRHESVVPGPFHCSSPTSDTPSPHTAAETSTNNYAAVDAVERQNFELFGRLPSELRDQV